MRDVITVKPDSEWITVKHRYSKKYALDSDPEPWYWESEANPFETLEGEELEEDRSSPDQPSQGTKPVRNAIRRPSKNLYDGWVFRTVE